MKRILKLTDLFLSAYIYIYTHTHTHRAIIERIKTILTITGGACGVMVIVTGYRHGDTSSIPGRDWLHFT